MIYLLIIKRPFKYPKNRLFTFNLMIALAIFFDIQQSEYPQLFGSLNMIIKLLKNCKILIHETVFVQFHQ